VRLQSIALIRPTVIVNRQEILAKEGAMNWSDFKCRMQDGAKRLKRAFGRSVDPATLKKAYAR
jgi:hypothetical protein